MIKTKVYTIPGTEIRYEEGENKIFVHLIMNEDGADWIVTVAPDMPSAIAVASSFGGEVLRSSSMSRLMDILLQPPTVDHRLIDNGGPIM